MMDSDQRPLAAAATGSTGEHGLDAVTVLTAMREVLFQWDLGTDEIGWSVGAAGVLGIGNTAAIGKGSAFQLMVGSEDAGTRYRAIWESGREDTGAGVAYRVHYRFHPNGRRNPGLIWLEERGCWFAGPNGKPQRIAGLMRIIDEPAAGSASAISPELQDELTGVLNRKGLLQSLTQALTPAIGPARPCVFMMAAINNLPVINQTFGFEAGDSVISNVTDRLRRQMRAGDIIARYSTNKLGFVIHDCEANGLQAVARRLMAAVRVSPIRCSGTEVSATISIGAVQLPLHADSVACAITAALEALEDARRLHQERLVCHSPGQLASQGRQRNVKTAETVLSALEHQRMRVALQEVVHAGSQEVAFYECLLRILAPDGALIPASEFVPVAEQLGLSRMIDQRVLELAVGMIKADAAIKISFNVSSLTSSDHNWLLLLHKLTGGDRKLTERLVIEITETMAIADLDETAAFVDALKEIGCRVALDDFGAGYTSFRNLKALAVDIVKLDGSFVRNLKDDKANQIFVRSMVALAHNFGMATVAEMVGDAATAGILAEAGIDYLQGYLFGVPQVAPLPMPVIAKT